MDCAFKMMNFVLKMMDFVAVLMELCGYIVNEANDPDPHEAVSEATRRYQVIRRYQMPFVAAEALASTPALATFILSGAECHHWLA